MNLIEGIKSRKSIRGYKSDPVPKEVIREILEIAGRSPSAMNTQPWEFVVFGGEVAKKIAEENAKEFRKGTIPEPEHQVVGWPTDNNTYRNRQIDLAKEIFKIMDIQREDKEKRMRWMERGFRHFDAPASIVILTDRLLAESAPLLDIGGVMQTICVAALEFGLATCIEDQSVLYPWIIRKHSRIPDEKKIIIAIAIGYPDDDYPVNSLESTRVDIDDITTWIGFD